MTIVEDARLGGIDLGPYAEFDASTWTAYPLLFRLLDDAAVAGVLWDRFLSGSQRAVIADGLRVGLEQARSGTALLAGLRELGKLVPGFQRREYGGWVRLEEGLVADAGGVAHAPVQVDRSSMHVTRGVLEGFGFGGGGGNGSAAVRGAQCVGGMGGRFLQFDVMGAGEARRVAVAAGGVAWQELRSRYAALVRYLTRAGAAPQTITVPAALLITGVGTLAGRLSGQRQYWAGEAHMPAFGAAEHFASARARAVELLEQTALERVELEPVPFSIAHRPADEPNALQASLMEHLPGLVAERGAGITVITDGTGSGKSVAGLEAARINSQRCGASGVVWLMPTTATADAAWQMLDRYVRAHQPERAPVTLVHSATWLNAAYSGSPAVTGAAPTSAGSAGPGGDGNTVLPSGDGPGGGLDSRRGGRAVTAPQGFLAGHDVALLAQFAAATVDQAQMAALPVQWSALRLLALSGKTVVVDEAHALTPFSQLQLLRLLDWLGALRTPVVLLSATMPASTSSALVTAYLSGAARAAGRRPPAVTQEEDFAPSYPGWLFADAETGTAHRMQPAARARHVLAGSRPVRIAMRGVINQPLGSVDRVVGEGERLAAVAGAISQVIHDGGCAAVSCATVAVAQDTYRYLQRTWPGRREELVLLHARFPGFVREERTGFLRRVLGPAGVRPGRLVVVTTSLLDTSLDVDVDVMVSDLASMARLLQRAGRLARFHLAWKSAGHRRPSWWRQDHVPQLTVLQPLGQSGATAVPREWGTAEPGFVLHATAALLEARGSDLYLDLPGGVQELVEQVHGDHSAFSEQTTALRRLLAGHLQRTTAHEHLSAVHLIPPAARISSLADLHRQYLTAADAVTRLGTLPRRLLPCYFTLGGQLALDRAGRQPLPDQTHLQPGHILRILAHTVPVPTAWVARRSLQHRPPASWQQDPLLADLVLLPAAAGDPGHAERFGRHVLRMDDELGLVHHQTR
ncbi:HD domain-containing protein [Streptomyces sp. NPDC006733]|uniref:HD domain-containing protein n=1 Tax=Streptomyces sp. NPDC006733 TaxID=3155460 RepID=UPI0033C4DA89